MGDGGFPMGGCSQEVPVALLKSRERKVFLNIAVRRAEDVLLSLRLFLFSFSLKD